MLVEQPFHTAIFVCNCKQQVPGARVILFSLRTEAKRRRGKKNNIQRRREKQRERTDVNEKTKGAPLTSSSLEAQTNDWKQEGRRTEQKN